MPELGFDTNEYSGNFTVQAIPNGRYKVVITASEKAALKSGNGSMLKLTLEVVEGEYRGSKIFVNLNLWHTASPAAVRIAREEMTAISHACAITKPTCSEQLHNIPMFVDVTCEKSNQDKLVNRVTTYYSVRQQQNAQRAQAPTPVSDQAPYKRSGTGAPSGNPGWGASQQPAAPAQTQAVDDEQPF